MYAVLVIINLRMLGSLTDHVLFFSPVQNQISGKEIKTTNIPFILLNTQNVV